MKSETLVNGHKVSIRRLALWVPVYLLVGCAPNYSQQLDEGSSSADPMIFVTDCNEIPLAEGLFAQVKDPLSYNNHIVLRFNQLPFDEITDETYIQFYRWKDSGSEIEHETSPLSFRVRMRQEYQQEIPLMYEFTSSFDKNLVEFMKGFSTFPRVPNKDEYLKNNFHNFEFLIQEPSSGWKGLSILIVGSDHVSGEAEGLLPPFELQYSDYQRLKPQALHPYHPLFNSPEDRTQSGLEQIEGEFCSLIPRISR